MRPDSFRFVTDPLKLKKMLWPHVTFYKHQIEMIYSVWDNDETVVAAANEMGKDFTAAFIILAFFLTRNPCRVVTTSAKDDHLRVLWGEIGDFINSSKIPLKADMGGPLIVNHREIRKIYKGTECDISYIKGMVASPDSIASMQGHHVRNVGDGIPRTLFVADECSSVPDQYHTMCSTWAHRMLEFGNTWDCNNFFKRAFKGDRRTGAPGGDLRAPNGRFYRKTIKIKAEDSPNVRYALAEIAAGKQPSGKMLIPGVKSWDRYCKHRQVWDKIQQTVCLDAEWYDGPEEKLYPKDWLMRAVDLGRSLHGRRRVAKAIGIDPAEGGDNTALAAVDEFGLIELISYPTPDTSVIPGMIIEFGRRHGVDSIDWVIDRGGGGKNIADGLRANGYKPRTVAFGETILTEIKRGKTRFNEKIEVREDKYVYYNRRAEMYGELRIALDPATPGPGFALIEGPDKCYMDLMDELSPIPLTYDSEGRLKLLPKKSKTNDPEEVTLTQLIGHSPDEADALALALHGMLHKPTKYTAGAVA